MNRGAKFEDVEIRWPTRASVLLHVVGFVVVSQMAVILDGARGYAYVILPVFLGMSLFHDSNITFRKHFRIKMTLCGLSAVWVVAGFFTLAQVISVEEGSPIIEDGIIYEITSWMAGESTVKGV